MDFCNDLIILGCADGRLEFWEATSGKLMMPRKYSRISTRAATYTQEDLDIAIEKIKNNELSYAAASQMYGIPTSTLSDRVLNKTRVVSNTLGRSTAIPIEMEKRLANCLRIMEKWGWGLSREEVLDITESFVKKNNLDTPFKNGRPGPDWFIAFRKRHNLSIKKPQPVEYLRKKMTDPFVIHEYFNMLENTLKELNLTDPQRIWNLDETSLCLDPTKTKVVGAKGEPCTRTTCGSAKENITVLTTVNAAGRKLDPLIVYKGKHTYKEWMAENPENYDFELAYVSSKRGWMETEIFFEYMSKIFIPNLGEERPVLMIYDGHVSHVDNKVVELAVENDITIVKLPAHTSHLLQPLDLAVFKSFKTTWDKKLVEWQRQNIGVKMRKQCFATMFAQAWQDTKPCVIQNGFKKGGIYPFNAEIIPKTKYDPSAYARWQKYMSQQLKQPKALKQLCLDAINETASLTKKMSVHNDTPNAHAPNSKENRVQLNLHTSFEELLLEKVTQHPQNTGNKMALKLKRVAKGGEVITKSFIQKQQEIVKEVSENKPGPSGINRKTSNAKPGPSGINRKRSNKERSPSPVSAMTDKTNTDNIITVKGKGIGKKTRKDTQNTIERSPSPVSAMTDKTNTDNIITVKGKGIGKKTRKDTQNTIKRSPSPVSAMTDKTNTDNIITVKGKGIGKKTRKDTQNTIERSPSPVSAMTDKTNTDNIITVKGKGIGKRTRKDKENIIEVKKSTSTQCSKVGEISKNKNGATKRPMKKVATKTITKKRRRLSAATDTTTESLQMSIHADSDIFSDILSDFETCETDFESCEKNKTESDDYYDYDERELEIQKIIREFYQSDENNDDDEKNKDEAENDNKENKKNKEKFKENTERDKKEVEQDEVRDKEEHINDKVNEDIEEDEVVKEDKGIDEEDPYIIEDKVEENKEIDEEEKEEDIETKFDEDKKDKSFRIGDKVLVRYYKKTWKYYVGVVENIIDFGFLYTISFYRTIGKNTNVKFVKPKRKDEDNVPDCNIVKEIELLQINENPEEYTIMDDNDTIYF